MKLSLKNIRGFTLSELMIASAILLIAILGLLAVLINCMILNDANNNLVIAVNDAQYVLEQIKGLAYADIAAYIAPVFSNLNSETISLTRNYIDLNRLVEVIVDVNWVERQRNKNFQLSTRIAR
ncbi:MAG: prepilin-type N-terminal cleavage/methylation domain-containing protein [Candidatus Omnitrophota bacterium]